MVAFDKAQGRFNYRVAGVAIQNGRVLLDRNTRNNYWVLPGGHPEMMEAMAAALRREMFEEIGVDVEIVRLLWVVENFFYKDKPVHELSFYFLMELDKNSPLLKSDGPFYGEEYGYPLVYQWQPIDEIALANLPLFPGFLTTGLVHLPNSTQHIVFDDARPLQASLNHAARRAPRKNTGLLPSSSKSIPALAGSDKKVNKA
jgi:ADP-ribose pyrophosphatase YjhB (NUDIX family)